MRNSHVFTQVNTAADIDRAKADRKIAVITGLQNSEHFRKKEDVKAFYQLGQRCSQLTYNTQNLLGSGGTERVDGGLSDFGVEIVNAMNEVGMLVDVSHCGDKTTLDAIDVSPKPIAITHSNCRALFNHPRLKTDEAIRSCAAKGGVMGITGVRMFVRDKEPTTIEHIVDHIDHVVKLVGIEHVGIGSDADLNGYDDMPPDQLKMLRGSYKASYGFRDKIDIEGFDHPKKVFDLTKRCSAAAIPNRTSSPCSAATSAGCWARPGSNALKTGAPRRCSGRTTGTRVNNGLMSCSVAWEQAEPVLGTATGGHRIAETPAAVILPRVRGPASYEGAGWKCGP